ncbi:MAG: nucleotidyltransferase family protein [Candidatus Paceibacterota bacterium]
MKLQPLKFKRKKENLDFLLSIIKYFFKTGEKPVFNKNILKDQSFFSLTKNNSTIGYAYLALKEYDEFKNTWLYNEMFNYFEKLQKPQDEKNLHMLKIIQNIAKKNEMPILILKEHNYKIKTNYKKGTRYSSDLDILIKKSDLFKLNNILISNNFGLRYVDFNFENTILFYRDGNIKFNKKGKGKNLARNEQIIKGVNEGYRNFEYSLIKNNICESLLEVHFYPNNYNYPKSHLNFDDLWEKSIFDNSIGLIKPEIRIIYDAEHFFTHLKYNKTFDNAHNTFNCHLKRLVDLAYNISLEEEIDWDKLIKIAKKNNLSTQAFSYLRLGKELLNINIPEKILLQLKDNAEETQLFIINLIDKSKLFQDKRDFWTYLYTKLFLYT